jgi:hypothetical protein
MASESLPRRPPVQPRHLEEIATRLFIGRSSAGKGALLVATIQAGIEVKHEGSGWRAGRDADHGGWPAFPPRLNCGLVRRGSFEFA